jgi:hypothetical protein
MNKETIIVFEDFTTVTTALWVVFRRDADVSEEHITSIFKVEE